MRNHVPTNHPTDNCHHTKRASSGNGSRCLNLTNANSTHGPYCPPLFAGSQPSHCAQMAIERIPKKLIGAVEDEWQLYRSVRSSARSEPSRLGVLT